MRRLLAAAALRVGRPRVAVFCSFRGSLSCAVVVWPCLRESLLFGAGATAGSVPDRLALPLLSFFAGPAGDTLALTFFVFALDVLPVSSTALVTFVVADGVLDLDLDAVLLLYGLVFFLVAGRASSLVCGAGFARRASVCLAAAACC